MPDAYIHRISGHLVARPRRWAMPPLLRFMIGIWPATVTGLAAAAVAFTTAM